VQPLNLFYTLADAPPASNDPYLDLQPGLKVMQISESHRWATGKGVRVAVIDTGMDTRHADLKDRVVGIRNFVDRNEAAFNADVHGTAVAGVIAATANNGIGLVGVAPEAEVLGLKACWESAAAQNGAHCSSFTLAKALNFAIDQDVDVINLSLGGPPDPLLQRLVAKALERNILVVGATSPRFPNGFPAAVDGVIAVTNAAASAQYIMAPGTQVLSTKPHDTYDFFTGSSFATANVAGVVTLIRQRKPHLPGKVVKDLIETTSLSEPPSANACRALLRIVEEGDCGPASATQTVFH
jgi:subtilisin